MKCSAAIVMLLIAGCRTHPAAEAPRAPALPPLGHGTVAARLLSDPDAPALRLGPGEEYVPPQLTPGNPLPEYPADLVRLRLPPHVVAVRMIVDESRHITDISASPLQISTDSSHRSLFEANVRAALQQWSVWPPAIRKFRPGPDSNGDGTPDYRILVDQSTLKAYFDLAFTFEIVNGEAVVRTELASQ